jgi:glutathione transport system substrate-binding protein
MYYVGWSSSTGEADWALRPLLYGPNRPPTQFNTAYYNNETVNTAFEKALATTDRNTKTELYRQAQELIWNDAPWAFLVTEQLLYATNKKLSGVYVMPDASFFFEQIDLAD